MRVIHLKELTTAIYYKPPEGVTNARLTRVPKGTEFDSETMIRQIFSYRQTIGDILGAPSDPRQGIKIVEMRKAMKILDALEAVEEGKPLILEDDQWSYLDNRAETFDWAIASPAIVQFCDDLHAAQAISKERLEEVAGEPTPMRKNGKSNLTQRDLVGASRG